MGVGVLGGRCRSGSGDRDADGSGRSGPMRPTEVGQPVPVQHPGVQYDGERVGLLGRVV